MARQKLSHLSQPFFVRTILRIYEFLASLKLAVTLILSLAVALSFATFLEANLGTAAVRWYVYHTPWFGVLLALLAVNVFCAASIRFPWKRHQTGFVITHIGLLVLLAGSAISYRGSLNSQLLVYKSPDAAKMGFADTSRIAVDQDEGYLVFSNLPGRPEPLKYWFFPGPFNWADHEPSPRTRQLMSWFGLDDPDQPWQHPAEPIYDDPESGIKVDVVDYYSRSEVRQLPFMALQFRHSTMSFELPISLEYSSSTGFAQKQFPMGLGTVLMWRTDDPDDLVPFQECIPQRTEEDPEGVLVFWSHGEIYQVSVARLRQLTADGRGFELEDGRTVELVQSVPWAMPDKNRDRLISAGEEPRNPAVQLKVKEGADGAQETHDLLCFAMIPSLNRVKQDGPEGFWAEYYHPEVDGQVAILEGPNNQLAFRAWQKKLKRVVASGALEQGEPVETWSTGNGVWQMELERYIPRETEDEEFRVIPLPFDKEDQGALKRVKIRVSRRHGSTGEETTLDEFWLRQSLPPPWERSGNAQTHSTDYDGEAPAIESVYNVKETDVGFAVKLVAFDLDVDPGTSMAANYTSHIVQADVRDEPRVRELWEKLHDEDDRARRQQIREELAQKATRMMEDHLENVDEKIPDDPDAVEPKLRKYVDKHDPLSYHVITMNEPLDYPDWNGRMLRLFQENYLGPGEGRPVGSIFRVNYDPGRSIKYLGCLFIVAGIFTMFYMRAYFFKRPGTATREDKTGTHAGTSRSDLAKSL